MAKFLGVSRDFLGFLLSGENRVVSPTLREGTKWASLLTFSYIQPSISTQPTAQIPLTSSLRSQFFIEGFANRSCAITKAPKNRAKAPRAASILACSQEFVCRRGKDAEIQHSRNSANTKAPRTKSREGPSVLVNSQPRNKKI